MNEMIIADGNRRPRKDRDAVLLDRLHGIRIAAKEVVLDGGAGSPMWRKVEALRLELAAFDRADVQTRERSPYMQE